MSKLVCFLAGLVTGAVALGTAAFAFDDTAASLSEDADEDEKEDAPEKAETPSVTDASVPKNPVHE